MHRASSTVAHKALATEGQKSEAEDLSKVYPCGYKTLKSMSTGDGHPEWMDGDSLGVDPKRPDGLTTCLGRFTTQPRVARAGLGADPIDAVWKEVFRGNLNAKRESEYIPPRPTWSEDPSKVTIMTSSTNSNSTLRVVSSEVLKASLSSPKPDSIAARNAWPAEQANGREIETTRVITDDEVISAVASAVPHRKRDVPFGGNASTMPNSKGKKPGHGGDNMGLVNFLSPAYLIRMENTQLQGRQDIAYENDNIDSDCIPRKEEESKGAETEVAMAIQPTLDKKRSQKEKNEFATSDKSMDMPPNNKNGSTKEEELAVSDKSTDMTSNGTTEDYGKEESRAIAARVKKLVKNPAMRRKRPIVIYCHARSLLLGCRITQIVGYERE